MAGESAGSYFSLGRPKNGLENWTDCIINVVKKDYADGYLKRLPQNAYYLAVQLHHAHLSYEFYDPCGIQPMKQRYNEEENSMLKITVKVDGMMCGMCESHINDAVRRAFPVKKVTSSHGKGETVILSEMDIDESTLRSTIDATGYKVKSVEKAPYEKKGLFHFGK